MSPPSAPDSGESAGKSRQSEDSNPPTYAAFSPAASSTSPATKQRSTILVHRKSPLLVATPPAVTRALAFSHPFILTLNHLTGLLTWSSGDPWESFLLVVGFWAVVLYGDVAVRYAGPSMVVMFIILGMYSRRYSPLSSTSWTGEKDQLKPESSAKHQKSLDEILETLNTFTSRCNGLIEPLMQLTDFLSTQRTATSATTRPALTSLFIRILFVSPLWIVLNLPPLRILTTQRVVLAAGTAILSWHSRPARVSRAILWRSRFIRRTLSFITGLQFSEPSPATQTRKNPPPPLKSSRSNQQQVANSVASKIPAPSAGVRFTFVVFENQRRWLGIGWTSTLLAYERAPWTDEHLDPSDPIDHFQLPMVESGAGQWRWVERSEWQVEGATKGMASAGSDGWIYYDNKVSLIHPESSPRSLVLTNWQWNDGRRGQDGWGKYTRRRKWYRDAELVEVSMAENLDGAVEASGTKTATTGTADAAGESNQAGKDGGDGGSGNQLKKRGFFRRSQRLSTPTSSEFSPANSSRNIEDHSPHIPPSQQNHDGDWDVGDEVKMSLG